MTNPLTTSASALSIPMILRIVKTTFRSVSRSFFAIDGVGIFTVVANCGHLRAGHADADAPVRLCCDRFALLEVEEPVAAIRLLKAERLLQIERGGVDAVRENARRAMSSAGACSSRGPGFFSL